MSRKTMVSSSFSLGAGIEVKITSEKAYPYTLEQWTELTQNTEILLNRGIMTKAELNLALSKTMEYLDKEPGSLEANNILIELKDQRVPFAIHADFYEFYSTEIMKAF